MGVSHALLDARGGYEREVWAVLEAAAIVVMSRYRELLRQLNYVVEQRAKFRKRCHRAHESLVRGDRFCWGREGAWVSWSRSEPYLQGSCEDKWLFAVSFKPYMDTRTKIIPRAEAVSRLAAVSSNGSRAVTACGWFEVLQLAHCQRLSDAKPGEARLIVFVYDDGLSRRGVLDAWSRAQMVAALGVVDCVVICDEAEAASLAARSNLPPPLWVEDAMPRDIVADVLQRHQAE